MANLPYLKDASFLKQIDLLTTKEQYTKITVLDWDEKPVRDITGLLTSGSVSLDGNSALRRTSNITVFIDDPETDASSLNSFLSLNKKITVQVGVKNTTTKYKDYDIIWYPLGTYVIIEASFSHQLTGTTVSLQLRDKMCLLNGDVGGTLPAAVTFNEIEEVDGNGNISITYPSVYQIITEAVNHWGGEPLDKIIISDIDTRVKKIMKWNSDCELFLCKPPASSEEAPILTTLTTLKNEKVIAGWTVTTYEAGDDVGYIYTDYYYPGGDLTGNAGASIVSVLDNIKKILGNFEYFYDLDGNFVFQEIKNYLNTSHATVELDKINQGDYIVDRSNGKAEYNFDGGELVTSYSNSPKYSEIKNDFVVWGTRETIAGSKIPVRYHLAIDKKPRLTAHTGMLRYKDADDGVYRAKKLIDISTVADLPKLGTPGLFYRTSNGKKWTWSNTGYIEVDGWVQDVKSADFRTELYLQGVEAETSGIASNYYYDELKAEWPKIYNIWNIDEEGKSCEPGFTVKKASDVNYFLDFVDTSTSVSQLSVNAIGRRTKVINESSVNCVFAPAIPDWIIIQSGTDVNDRIAEAKARGQQYTVVDDAVYAGLAAGGSSYSAYEVIKNSLYQYTKYNGSISVNCLPIYHLDTNVRIAVKDVTSGISGDYVVNKITLPLDTSGTMSISATKAVDRF